MLRSGGCANTRAGVSASEAKGMAAIDTHELIVSTAGGDEAHEVAKEDADERMTDRLESLLSHEKRVAAMACILGAPVAPRDRSHAMTEEAAQVANFLAERGRVTVRVFVMRVDQRVSALRADVLAATVAINQGPVCVVAEKT